MVYVLYNDKKIEVLKADNVSTVLVETKPLKLKSGGEVTAFTIAGNELWVGDNKGFVYILDSATLAMSDVELKTVYGNPVVSVSASHNHALVAVGDSKGYLTAFSKDSKA